MPVQGVVDGQCSAGAVIPAPVIDHGVEIVQSTEDAGEAGRSVEGSVDEHEQRVGDRGALGDVFGHGKFDR